MDIIKYFWIRVFDYKYDRDSYSKGILLDEFYTNDIEDKNEVKEYVKNKYCGNTSQKIMFAKPRKKDGLYAIIMESDKFFYDRYYLKLNTNCFYCHKHIEGKVTEFPRMDISEGYIHEDLEDLDKTAYFCSYDCKNKLVKSLRYEGEFQEKEAGSNGDIFGYIYLIYNRIENKYYIGQTRYMPFFRWQEHIKNGGKGDITDMSFSVITEVYRNRKISESDNQKELNNIEAWWIKKYIEEGYDVFNIANPKLTLDDYRERFNEMVLK